MSVYFSPSRRQQKIIDLRKKQKLSYQKIGDLLNIAACNARRICEKALKRLKNK